MALFITFEGGEGSGKSVQARLLYRRLSLLAIPALLTHEPGGTSLGRKISYWLKWARNTGISPLTELLLFNASRAQLLEEVIRPNLKSGKVVICDRYVDSTTAYQSYGRGLKLETVETINNSATQGLIPDLTVLLDIPVEETWRNLFLIQAFDKGKGQGVGLKNILITGGARSGKSHFAQELALKSGKAVLFVATATAGDEEMRQRIEEHRRTRPAAWSTLEVTTHVGNQILNKIGKAQVVIVDCVTLLVNNIFSQHTNQAGNLVDASLIENEVTNEIEELIGCIDHVDASFIVVTNEVGMGLVPANQLGRLYRDLLGKANRLLAERADEVYLMVAGLPVKIKPAYL